jgi:hypothetical protein
MERNNTSGRRVNRKSIGEERRWRTNIRWWRNRNGGPGNIKRKMNMQSKRE